MPKKRSAQNVGEGGKPIPVGWNGRSKSLWAREARERDWMGDGDGETSGTSSFFKI